MGEREKCFMLGLFAAFANWHQSTFSIHAQTARSTKAGEEAPSHMLLTELPMACICSGSSNKTKHKATHHISCVC